MSGQFIIALVHFRLVAAGLVYAAFEVVGNHDRGRAADELEGAHMRAQPVRQTLRPRGFGEGVVGAAQHGDEDLRRDDFAGQRIDDRHRLAGVVDKQLLARAMDLPHRALQGLPPAPVKIAELAVGIGGGAMVFPVFLPQQLQRHALAFEFLMDRRVIGRGKLGRHPRRRRCTENEAGERLVIEPLGQGPGKPCALGCLGVLGDRAQRQTH